MLICEFVLMYKHNISNQMYNNANEKETILLTLSMLIAFMFRYISEYFSEFVGIQEWTSIYFIKR